MSEIEQPENYVSIRYSYQVKKHESGLRYFGYCHYGDYCYTFEYYNIDPVSLMDILRADCEAGNLPLHQPE